MLSRHPLREALRDGNVRAFLDVIRAGEGTSDPDGYRRHFGGRLFTGYADHPRVAITAGGYTSTAAGAYQLLARTWDGLVQQYGFPDFSPASQDEAAVALIIGRGALAAVRAGRLDEAIAACNREWASLPGSPYGQPTRTLAQALATYSAAGGKAGSGAPAAAPAPTTPTPARYSVPPFIAAALPALIEAIPKLGRLFGSGSETSTRNLAAVQTVAELVQGAVGARNIQEAVEAIQADPQALQAATRAVEERWYELSEAGGGGIDGARQADAAFIAKGDPASKSPAFLISLMLMSMPTLLLVDVLFVHPAHYSGELRVQIVTAVLAIIAMVGGYWIGTSFSSARKTELAGQRKAT